MNRATINLRNNKVIYIIIVFSTIIYVSVLLHFLDNNCTKIINLYDDVDLHYNIITINAVFAGFLFTAVGLILSLLSSKSVKRLWNNGYMDGMYHAVICSIILHIISLVVGIFIVFKFSLSQKIKTCLFITEIALLLLGIILFVYSIVKLVQAINEFKSDTE